MTSVLVASSFFVLRLGLIETKAIHRLMMTRLYSERVSKMSISCVHRYCRLLPFCRIVNCLLSISKKNAWFYVPNPIGLHHTHRMNATKSSVYGFLYESMRKKRAFLWHSCTRCLIICGWAAIHATNICIWDCLYFLCNVPLKILGVCLNHPLQLHFIIQFYYIIRYTYIQPEIGPHTNRHAHTLVHTFDWVCVKEETNG